MNTPDELVKELLPKAYREKDVGTIKHATELMEQWASIKKRIFSVTKEGIHDDESNR